MNWFQLLLDTIFRKTVDDIQATASKEINKVIERNQRKSDHAFEKVRKLEAQRAAAQEQVKKGETYRKNVAKLFTDE